MNKKNKLIVSFALAAAVLAVIGFAFLLIAVLREYDLDIGHFKANAVFAWIAYAVIAIGVVLSVAAGFLCRNFKLMHGKNAGVFLSFSSALCAILIFASVILNYFEKTADLSQNPSMINYLCILFGILGGAGLVLFVFYGAYRTAASQLLSYAIPVYFIFETLVQYFDQSITINSPLKILSQLAFVSFAVFTAFDSGVYIGKKNILPRYVFACMASVALGGAVSLTTIVSQFVSPDSFNITVVESCTSCAFALLAAAKLHHVIFSLKPVANEGDAEE